MGSLRAIVEETRRIVEQAGGKPVALVWPGCALRVLTAEEWEREYGAYLQVQMSELADRMHALPPGPGASSQAAKAGTEAVVVRGARRVRKRVSSHGF